MIAPEVITQSPCPHPQSSHVQHMHLVTFPSMYAACYGVLCLLRECSVFLTCHFMAL